MLTESRRLEKQIELLQQQIKELPEGKLISGKNGTYHQWYQSDGHSKKYIPKKDRNLIEQLAIKKYLTYQLEDLSNEKRAIEFYLQHHREDVGKAEQLLTDTSEYRKLISPYFEQKSQDLQDWMQASFEQNPQHKENLIHKTGSGNLVRSKSEAIIDTFLYTNKISFRYECALSLGKVKVYPDFTIKHPKTGEIYYWEHFGMMDNEGYIKKAFSKLQLYALHGIIPSINLITTYETKEKPLSTDAVMKIIEDYFLM